MIPRILIAEDDPQYARWLRHHIESIWPESEPKICSPSRLAARLAETNTDPPELVLLGAHFATRGDEDCEGFQLLRQLRRLPATPPVVVVAAGGSELTAVKALRLNAADYQPRDLLNAPGLERSLRRALARATRQRNRLRRRARRPSTAPAGGRAAQTGVVPTVPPLLQPELPGYTLRHEIGASSRATVWLAVSHALGRTVALKISRLGPDEIDPHQGFAREYEAIRALRHPSIVDIFDYGVHRGREYLAMEYFPCGDLKLRLQNPIAPERCLDYLRRIAEALQVVHGAGLLHRDLKPPNIMLREDASVVLIDFGLAKRVGSTTGSTAVGILRGSPYYMSPEQVRGLPLDARSDLYSLGVVFYEMLTGRKPYLGTTAIELMEQHVAGRRAPLPIGLDSFEALLAPLMATDREDRFPDAATLLEALTQVSADVGTTDDALATVSHAS